MTTIDRTRTAFIDRCVETVADSAVVAAKQNRGQPHSRKLLQVLAQKKNILITTHLHPDPDALASSQAMAMLLSEKLPDAKISVSVKGRLGGGANEGFVKAANFKLTPWDDAAVSSYDGIVLMDCQPTFAYSPLPAGVMPTCVIDHHRNRRGRMPKCAFCDIRPEVGATGSIVFSYFLEQRVSISPDLAASLLYAIESDLAGAAGAPGNLDNVALSNLTLLANTRKLYQMRYVKLPQSFYAAYMWGLNHAMVYDHALMSHIDKIEALEMPAVLADFLLRFDQVDYALVSAVHENRLIVSLRTSDGKVSAADLMRRLLRNIGQGGGHRTKAGGFMPLETGSAAEIDRKRNLLRRRYLRALGIVANHGLRLTPKCD